MFPARTYQSEQKAYCPLMYCLGEQYAFSGPLGDQLACDIFINHIILVYQRLIQTVGYSMAKRFSKSLMQSRIDSILNLNA